MQRLVALVRCRIALRGGRGYSIPLVRGKREPGAALPSPAYERAAGPPTTGRTGVEWTPPSKRARRRHPVFAPYRTDSRALALANWSAASPSLPSCCRTAPSALYTAALGFSASERR